MNRIMGNAKVIAIKKLPMGYARPSEKEIQKQRKQALAILPTYLESLHEMRKEALKNGLTQEILDELLADDCK